MKKLLILLLFPLSAAAQQIDTIIFKFANGDIKYLVARGGVGVGTDSLYVQHLGVRSILSPMDLPVNTATGVALDGKQASGNYASGITNTGDNATNTQYSGLSASKADIASPAFTGTATGIGIPVYAQVTGSNATTTGQALVNITGLSVPLTTNAVYEFEAIMTGSTTAVTTGTAYGVNYSVAGGAIESSITGSSTSTATKTLRINAFNTATTLYLATSAQTGGILIKGRVTTGANAGNLTISHLKLTSGTSTIFIGSVLKVTRIS